ncbi:hypothetical protein MTO96_034353 [Rhipicephalus appendiculatus]
MLDNFSIVGTSTKERILSEVRANLEGISPLSDRLLCVGGLYCGIAALGNALSPWELYRVNPFKGELDLLRIAQASGESARHSRLSDSVPASSHLKTPLRMHYCPGHSSND